MKTEFLWSMIRSCGSRQELERVRAYLETGLDQVAPPDACPWQRSPWGYFPGLQARPWHDPASVGWDRYLLPFVDSFCQELESVKAARAVRPQGYSPLVSGGSWNVCYLHFMGKASRIGRLLCPVTTKQTERLPGGCGKAFLSALAPGSHIKPHNDATNTRLRMHLGLETPPGCSMRVGDECREWQRGGLLLFDGSFEHEVWNRGDQTRWVLIIDLWHPELTEPERQALHRLGYFRNAERKARRKAALADRLILRQIKSSGLTLRG
jgi:hypothetical protein